uniref:Uncharacterized protein n=1 Tax=Oryza nivara TaxID=4536 RepID=A0A679BCF8_ORYNI|nr:hypothetical protein [Oryza sativa f. spontanea]BBF89865.1 hypothetical protein [Oryza sativa f. spontanea]
MPWKRSTSTTPVPGAVGALAAARVRSSELGGMEEATGAGDVAASNGAPPPVVKMTTEGGNAAAVAAGDRGGAARPAWEELGGQRRAAGWRGDAAAAGWAQAGAAAMGVEVDSRALPPLWADSRPSSSSQGVTTAPALILLPPSPPPHSRLPSSSSPTATRAPGGWCSRRATAAPEEAIEAPLKRKGDGLAAAAAGEDAG